MEKDHEKSNYKLGVLHGAVISALSMLIICGIVFGIFFSRAQEKTTEYTHAKLTMGDEVTAKINMLISQINSRYLYDYSVQDMADALYKGVMSSLGDPYTRYYTAEEYQELAASSAGTYCGIGVVVTQNTDTGEIYVVKPYDNSPGEEAGIQSNDIIMAVDGNAVTGVALDEVVDQMKGVAGTKVTLTIKREDSTFDVEVERRTLDVTTVAHKMMDDNIGYIVISGFDGVTTDQFAAAINDLISQGMTGLIVDIRNNPGGRLDVVNAILDSLLPEGLIVYTEDKDGNRVEYSSDADTILNVPCAVLVNGKSASASEVFTGAMQDYGVAEIIGTQTYGKGIVQSIVPFSDGSAIKITIENYYTPNGNNIHKIGITPDEVVELDADAYAADGTDTQLNAAIEYLEKNMTK